MSPHLLLDKSPLDTWQNIYYETPTWHRRETKRWKLLGYFIPVLLTPSALRAQPLKPVRRGSPLRQICRPLAHLRRRACPDLSRARLSAEEIPAHPRALPLLRRATALLRGSLPGAGVNALPRGSLSDSEVDGIPRELEHATRSRTIRAKAPCRREDRRRIAKISPENLAIWGNGGEEGEQSGAVMLAKVSRWELVGSQVSGCLDGAHWSDAGWEYPVRLFRIGCSVRQRASKHFLAFGIIVWLLLCSFLNLTSFTLLLLGCHASFYDSLLLVRC
jgi:hypothetical protein